MTSSAPCPGRRPGSGRPWPRSPATSATPWPPGIHDLGEDPARAIDGAAIFLGDARASAAALAGDLGYAQQQLAAINGEPAPHREDNS